jgi:hypothetical protein
LVLTNAVQNSALTGEKSMPPTKEIRLDFAFEKSPRPTEAPFGIARAWYSTGRTGEVSAPDYVALAFDYVPRLYWASESQGQLDGMSEFIGFVLGQLQSHALPRSQDWQLRLEWCQNLRMYPASVAKPNISIVSTVVEASSLRRSLRNPVPLSPFRKPTFGMHWASLNAALEVAALTLGGPWRKAFNLALQELLTFCQTKPGFWKGNVDGPYRSMQVVDQILQAHGLR